MGEIETIRKTQVMMILLYIFSFNLRQEEKGVHGRKRLYT